MRSPTVRQLLPALAATGSEHIELAIERKSLRTLTLIESLHAALRAHAPDIVQMHSRRPGWTLHFALCERA